MPTSAQLKKIFAGMREARLSQDELRDLVAQVSGQRSTRALTVEQAIRVIDHLVRLGARAGTPKKRPSGQRRPPGVTALPTPSQRVKIDQLRQEIGGELVRDEYFEGFCGKVIGKPHPLSSADAAKVVEALKRRRSWRPKRSPA